MTLDKTNRDYSPTARVSSARVCPGLIYPSAPSAGGLKERIEEYLGNDGVAVAVAWYDDEYATGWH